MKLLGIFISSIVFFIIEFIYYYPFVSFIFWFVGEPVRCLFLGIPCLIIAILLKVSDKQQEKKEFTKKQQEIINLALFIYGNQDRVNTFYNSPWPLIGNKIPSVFVKDPENFYILKRRLQDLKEELLKIT